MVVVVVVVVAVVVVVGGQRTVFLQHLVVSYFYNTSEGPEHQRTSKGTQGAGQQTISDEWRRDRGPAD